MHFKRIPQHTVFIAGCLRSVIDNWCAKSHQLQRSTAGALPRARATERPIRRFIMTKTVYHRSVGAARGVPPR